MEDLWAFNDERVARAIYQSEIPVISAVGHEPDVTISDFVADLRAATPSNAAELAVPDQSEVWNALQGLRERMEQNQLGRLAYLRTRLERCTQSRSLTDPMTPVNEKRMQLDYVQQRMISAMERRLSGERGRFSSLSAGLDAMSPLKVLSRGYSVTTKKGKVLSSVNQAEVLDTIQVRLSDGTLDCTVNRIEE